MDNFLGDDEFMAEVNQIANMSEQQQEEAARQIYIDWAANDMATALRAALTQHCQNIPEPTRSFLRRWQEGNRHRIGLQMALVLKFLLKRELLEK